MHHLTGNILAVVLSHRKWRLPQALPLKAVTERMAVREHRTLFVTARGSGISQTRQLLIPDPDGVRTLPAPQILILPAGPPRVPQRGSISHTCRGYGGKILAGEGSVPRFLLPELSGREACVVLWLEAGRRCRGGDGGQDGSSLWTTDACGDSMLQC